MPHQLVLDGNRDAGVDDDQPRAGLAREDVDRGTARGEVEHHLRRDLLRIGGDALRGDTMVAGRHHDSRLERQRHGAADRGDPAAELLEPPEAAARLRLSVVCVLRRRIGGLVDERDAFEQRVHSIS